MQKNDDIIRFRASGVGALMTDPRSAADKKSGKLSKTAKSFVEKSWLFDTYAIEEVIETPEMMKGKMCEEAATTLIQQIIPSKDYRKINRGENAINLKNDFFSGTYDIALETEKIVEDIKNSFTPQTFMKATITKLNYTQIQVYLDLLNYDKGRIIYCLVNTPNSIVIDLESRMFYKYGSDTENLDYLRASALIRHMHTPELYIPAENRVKKYEVKRNQEYIDELKSRVIKAREYYRSLSINDIDITDIAKYTALAA